MRALQNVGRIAISPDGKNVYAPSRSLDAVVVFDRDANGVLTQKAGTEGCYTSSGTTAANEGCSTGPPAITSLGGANDVAVSADGKNVYVAAPTSNVLVTFQRLTDGTLIFLGTSSSGILGINQVTTAPDTPVCVL